MKKGIRFSTMFLIVALLATFVAGCGDGQQGDPFKLGMISLENKQFAKAIEHFEAANKQKPNDAKILLELGRAHVGNRTFEKAIDQFKRVIELDDNMVDAHLRIAEAEMDLGHKAGSDDPAQLNHYMSAQTQCLEAIRKKKDFAEAHLKLATVFGLRNMPEQKLEEIEKALALDPSLADANITKAWIVYGNDQSSDEALDILDNGLREVEARLARELKEAKDNEDDTKKAEGRAKLDSFKLSHTIADIQRLRGQTDEAIRTYTAIKDNAPFPAYRRTILYWLGRLYLQKSDWDAVEQQADGIQSLGLPGMHAAYLRGRAALGRGLDTTTTDKKKRRELLDKAVKELSGLSESKGPEDLFWLGRAYKARGERDRLALAEFQKALGYIDEKSNRRFAAQIHMALAEVLLRKGTDGLGEAKTHCEKALSLTPGDTNIMMSLAVILNETGDRLEAKRLIEWVLEIEPQKAMAEFKLAQINFLLGRPEQALQDIQKAIEMAGENGADAKTYLLQGDIHRVLEQYEKAIESYKQALEHDPSYSAAHENLARVYMASDQNDQAIALLKNYMKEQPARAQAPALLARVYEKQGKIDLAIKYYEATLEKDKDNEYLRGYGIARLHLAQGRPTDAIEKWRELLAIAEKRKWRSITVSVRNNIVLALMLNGEADEALAEARNAGTLFNIFVSAYAEDFDKAREALRKTARITNNSKGAIEQFIQACETDPPLGRKVITKLAFSLIDKHEGLFDSAEQNLKEAIELMPKSVLLRMDLLKVYSRQNQRDKTVEECNNIIQLAPGYALPHVYLAGLAETEKETDKAIAEYNKAAELDKRMIPARLRLAGLHYANNELEAARLRIEEVWKLLEDLDPESDETKSFKSEVERLQIAIQATTDPKAAAVVVAAKYRKSAGNPDPTTALQFARLNILLGQHKEAVEVCDKFLAKHENNIQFRQIKAEALRLSGHISKAEKTLKEAIGIDDTRAQLYIELARVYLPFAGLIQLSESVLRRGLEKLPQSSQLKFELARVCLTANKLDEADVLVTELIAELDEEKDAKGIGELRLQLELEKTLKLTDDRERKPRLDNIIASAGKMSAATDKLEAFVGYIILGRTYLLGLSDKRLAADAFEEAKKRMPDRSEPNTWLAPIYFERERYTKSAEALKVLQKNTPDASTATRIAIALQAGEKLEEAEKAAREALKLPPDRKPASEIALANILLDAGKTDEAIKTIKEMELNKQLKSGYEELVRELKRADRHAVAMAFNKGLFFAMSGRLKLVPTCYEEARERAPNENIFILMHIARSYAGINQLDKAAETFQAAIDLKPDYLIATAFLGEVYKRQGKTASAIEAYREGLDKDPENAQLMKEIGVLYHSVENLAEAVKYYTMALKIDPDNGHANYLAGRTYQDLNDIPKALEFYEKALDSDPEGKEDWRHGAYNNAAWLNTEKENPNLRKALRYALSAKELAPRLPEIRDTLGWVLYKRGQFKPALDELKIAAARPPTMTDGSVQYHYAAALEKLGRKDDAISALENALGLKFSVEYNKKQTQDLLERLKAEK
ncbi:MAG: tetratricopeptide repeat protein [Planctomycetes bacterium]|nr:tetratricopeptide repeat protein [Planctomycetota bacterium]